MRYEKKGGFFPGRVFLFSLILIGGAFFLLAPFGQGRSLADQAGEVAFPVKNFQDGKARFYEYKTGEGIAIKYFILKSSDGVIRAAFDACDVCWPQGKGYFQKDDTMVCRN